MNIGTAGGTAGKGAKTCKVSLVTTWLDKIGAGEGHRELESAIIEKTGGRETISPGYAMFLLTLLDHFDLPPKVTMVLEDSSEAAQLPAVGQ